MVSIRSIVIATTTLCAAGVSAAHTFNLVNRCGYAVPLLLSNWGRTPYTGAAIGTLSAGQTKIITIPTGWNGRICHNVGGCSANCYGKCGMTEFNLDTGDFYTPQAYDISNIQDYTIAQQIAPSDASCQTVTCRSRDCPCSQAYPVGDLSGCGSDYPVKGCGAGDKGFTITYCP